MKSGKSEVQAFIPRMIEAVTQIKNLKTMLERDVTEHVDLYVRCETAHKQLSGATTQAADRIVVGD